MKKNIYKYKVVVSARAKVLNASLLWFGIGLIFIFVMSSLFALMPFMTNIAFSIFSNPTLIIFAFIAMIICVLMISWRYQTASIQNLILMYLGFCFIQSLFISLIFLAFINSNKNSQLMLVFTIPGITMAIMGFMGYKQIFDFSKIGRFLFFALIGLIIFGIAMFFVTSDYLLTLYSLIGYSVFALFAGYDLYRISRLDQVNNITDSYNKTELTRLGIYFGLSLLINYIQMVWFLLRLMRI